MIVQFERPSGELAAGTLIRAVRVRPPRTTMEFSVQAFPQPDGGWELQLAWRADGCDEHSAAAIVDEITATLHRIAELSR